MVSEEHERLVRPALQQISKSLKSHVEPATPRSVTSTRAVRDSAMEDPDGVLASVALCIEQLRGASFSPQEKENASKQLLVLVEERDQNAKKAITSHTQAIPLLVNLLRTGTTSSKINVAAVMALLCKEEELRMKVLLGGCVPPLLALLKVGSTVAHSAAAKAIFAVTTTVDHVGAKIFSTEGVVPSLWEQFQPGNKLETSVLGLLTGALRNLCNKNNVVEGFWSATLDAGGIQVLAALLGSGNSDAQANAASILASLMDAVETSGPKVFSTTGALDQLFKLLENGHETGVRAEAAGALRALTQHSPEARQYITKTNGGGMIRELIAAVVAPSKEFMQGVFAQQLQENAMGSLANVLGGMTTVVGRLAEELNQQQQVGAVSADTVGALAYALMVIDSSSAEKDSSGCVVNPSSLERLLVKLMEHQDVDELLKEHVIEALASLYSNTYLASNLEHAEAKKMLVGLATLADPWIRVELIRALSSICSGKAGLWESIRGRDGVQFMISLLGVSSEQQQEYAVALLSILSRQIDESNWAITASGGIPPLVQLLETGSPKAKEDSAIVLGNLCSHSEDIRACVETAEAEAALLWLLKNASPEGQEIAARAITKLVRRPDADTLSQLTAMLVGDLPSSKQHVLEVTSCLLAVVAEQDMGKEGAAGYEAFDTLMTLLESPSSKETQEKAASVIARVFALRQDMHHSPLVQKAVGPLNKLVRNINEEEPGTISVAAQAALALAALFSSIREHGYVKDAAVDAITPLVALAKVTSLAPAEAAVKALAFLLVDEEVALDVPLGDLIDPFTRILREGSEAGRDDAAAALARLFAVHSIDDKLAESISFCGTMVALADLLTGVSFDQVETIQALDALSAVARSKTNASYSRQLLGVIESLGPLVTCAAIGSPVLCEKVIEVLARLCQDKAAILGGLIANTDKCIASLADRIIRSSNVEVKIGGTALLICAAKEHGQKAMDALAESGCASLLIQTLVGMLQGSSGDGDFETASPGGLGATTVALWLLSVIATHDSGSKVAIMEAGAIDVLAEKLAIFAPNARQAKVEESGNNWISALLLAILFLDRDVSRAPATSRAIPALSLLLKSEDTMDRYFSAQALASLVCHGSRGTLLAVANSGAVPGLISLLGSAEVEAGNLVTLSEEFLLVSSPDQVALERLFRVDDIRYGATARKAIPALVELLKPNPGRPGAPPLALSLLTQIAEANHVNRVTMAEAGALEALTKYLSLGPQDAIEEAAAELLRILFSSPELRRHDSASGAVDQLVAVLRMGARGSRYTAARALQGVFGAEQIRGGDIATQAIVPLVEMLSAAVEREQRAAIGALISLAADNPHKAIVIGDVELNTLEILSKILSADTSSSSLQLKEHAAELCSVLFANARVRSKAAASTCILPLIDLLSTAEAESVQHVATQALDNLLDDEQQAEAVAAYGAVVPLVELIVGSSFKVHEVAVSALIKLGKDRPLCKLDMVKAGVIDRVLVSMGQEPSPDSFCARGAELLRILTNNSSIAKSTSAAKAVEPLFTMLQTRAEIGPAGQHSAVQTLVNIIEKPQCTASQTLSCGLALQPLLQLLESTSQSVQQVAAELLSHLLVEPRFQQDPITQAAVPALVKLAGSSGALSVQQRAVNALELASTSWPDALVESGGISEVSKIILQTDPPAPHGLWECAAKLLSNVSQNYCQELTPAVVSKLLRSTSEATVAVSLHALLVMEKEDASTAEIMAENGAVESLVEILRSHQCEEAAARLLESLVNNVTVRGMKATKLAVCPLSEFLLDPQTQSEQARLLAALALGDLFQNDTLCKSTDAVSACRALVSLLEGQHNEEIQMVAICALQNLVVNSRPNKRAVAEAGGVQALQELVATASSDTAVQAAALIRILFSNYTIQEFASIEVIQALLALLEKDLWSREPIKDEVIKAINTLFNLYPKFRITEIATASIPLLIGAMKTESEVAQEAALDTLFLFRQTWSASPEEEGRAQANAMADAIPVLQMLMRTGPQRFHERIELLLQCLPGNLLVNIKRGNNLRQSMGGTNAFCKITLGSGPPRQTRVVSNNSAPQWEQGFAWAFDTPPKGQKLHISCKNKGAFGKASLGKVTIQIDRVVLLGNLSGEYQLKPDSNRDGSPRTLEIEFQWSNR
ncbi:protein CELLULOSE SYNTHASE INTERACTIVE 1 [Selaginella moellendorffii]|uniref:protein CELLULOSE SYNTHASE INTERACTIVE 1 n=1 Tax=Selaginella moellendorffii TaxID=88036 RepID=UPI000D1CFC44|nr:protein CELLULOSE SYNTHASE INTERACTIVE 1 [Selaginella moellendorffii]|eukprot:XP_024541091.1 protein CELLULOSE SYNTHASE INTERACTIVE 1 [Selaginella moellendorffii]